MIRINIVFQDHFRAGDDGDVLDERWKKREEVDDMGQLGRRQRINLTLSSNEAAGGEKKDVEEWFFSLDA